jgi:hypothetical protein
MPKIKMTTWVDAGVHAELCIHAQRTGVSMSEAASQVLRDGVLDVTTKPGLEETVRQLLLAVQRRDAQVERRLAVLAGRAALEAGANRRLMVQMLAHALDPERARSLNAAAWSASVENMRKPVDELLALFEVNAPASEVQNG